jgi:hypothetical protein
MRIRRAVNALSLLLLTIALLQPASGLAAGQAAPPASPGAPERTGQQVYESICITCHGPDGKGKANAELIKIITLPDFTDCEFAVREADADWLAVAHKGGPARGFSPLMAPWGGTYTTGELTRAVGYIRHFCTDDRWPRGELNLPRPLVTGKAFPEDEVVVSTAAATEGQGLVANRFIYERRIGPLNQVEVSVPISWAEQAAGGWQSGIGDIALGYKRTLAHSLERGNILSASAEVVLPTGSERRGLGGGVTVFEPFVTFAQLLPGNAFIQTQAGLEIPAASDHDTEIFWRGAIGKSLEQGRFGRTWSPMLEVLGARAMADGAATNWDVVPQVQITLNARQHVRINAGVRIPATHRQGRSATVITYLLWDWFDGGFFDGW